MNKKVKKLNQLANPESFLQINTVKGFKYVDCAGEIVNHYHIGDKPPVFSMNIQSLIFEQPKPKIEQLKISSKDIWAKFIEPDSLEMALNMFDKESKVICGILEIDKINRVGWRNNFVYEFQNKEERVAYFKKLTNSKFGNALNIKYEISIDSDIKAVLGIEPVQKNDDKKTEGALFDIDVYTIKETNLSELATVLRKFREYFGSEEGFLAIVNLSLE